MMKTLFLPFVCLLLIASCGYNQREISRVSPIIKVLLFQGKEVRIKPARNYVLTANSRKLMSEGPITLELSNSFILFNEMPIASQEIEIVPADYFQFNGKKYRGNATVVADQGELQLINVLDIESYIRGVLPMEVSVEWNAEALKAQAVVSRTFALFEITSSRKKNRSFDVYDDTRSQVYNGLDLESKFTSIAADSTFGEVVRYEGKVIQAFFHSASGGMTESSKEAFGYDYPYLTPVLSPYGNVYKDNQWEIIIPLEKIRKDFRLAAPVVAVQVKERTASKRIKTILITDKAGRKTELTAGVFRNTIGNTLMKSTRANIRLTNGSLQVSGMGYGHGVGMGQWDAQGMSLQGYRYLDILGYFYPGTKVEKVW